MPVIIHTGAIILTIMHVPVIIHTIMHVIIRVIVRHDLFMPRVRTTMAHTRSFASIGPSLWNHFPPPFRSFVLSATLSLSLSLSP